MGGDYFEYNNANEILSGILLMQLSGESNNFLLLYFFAQFIRF